MFLICNCLPKRTRITFNGKVSEKIPQQCRDKYMWLYIEEVPQNIYDILSVIKYIIIEMSQNIPIYTYSVTPVYNGISIITYLNTPTLWCLFRNNLSWSILLSPPPTPTISGFFLQTDKVSASFMCQTFTNCAVVVKWLQCNNFLTRRRSPIDDILSTN